MTTKRSAAPQTGTAIFLFCLGLFCFAVNDGLGKWLVGAYPVGELMLLRTFGAAVFLLPMLARYPESRRVPVQLGLNALRIVVMAADTFAFYDATRSLPLADVMTFYLAAPLFVTVLAVLLLRERIGPWRITAVLLGFAGVLVALRPSGQTLSSGALEALGGSLMFATGMIITRRLRQTHWVTLIIGQFVGAATIGGLLSRHDWITPSVLDFGLMLLVGFVSVLCFICINRALQSAEASLLAPFQYTSIIWGVLIGWLVWGDLPTLPVSVGIVLIVASGSLVWFRERSARSRTAAEVPAL